MTHADQRAQRVLVVDDDPEIRKLLVELLRSAGFEALQAANGAEGLARFQQDSPSAVLLDVNMPGMDGMQVLREARRLDPSTPIILVTAQRGIGSAIEAVKEGAYDYITKPFENDDLILTVRRALESKRLRQENQTLRSRVELLGDADPAGAIGLLDGNRSFKEIVRHSLVKVEREVLQQALKQTGGNKAKAARILRIDYKTIHTKTKEYGLHAARASSIPPSEA
jgi:DNA-binding NtrC family response regulator